MEQLATSSAGMMEQKKPALWIQRDNEMVKLASFVSEKARIDFVRVMTETYHIGSEEHGER